MMRRISVISHSIWRRVLRHTALKLAPGALRQIADNYAFKWRFAADLADNFSVRATDRFCLKLVDISEYLINGIATRRLITRSLKLDNDYRIVGTFAPETEGVEEKK